MATRCGDNICYDDDAYCCYDDGEEQCCVSFYVYQSWWFWFIWATMIFILVACTLTCYRACRRRRQRAYVVLRNPQHPPVYGSVYVTSSAHNAQAVGPAPASAPVQPPPYAAYPQEKPPAYSTGQP